MMNIRKILIYLGLLLLLPFALKVKGDDFGHNQSLFTEIKADIVGDVPTVIISEQSRASTQVQTRTEKTTEKEQPWPVIYENRNDFTRLLNNLQIRNAQNLSRKPKEL